MTLIAPVPVVTAADVQRIALREFGQENLTAALMILNRFRDDETPHRVHVAAMLLAQRRLQSLEDAIQMANMDWRDVIAAAEYPEYLRFESSRIGFTGREEELRPIIARDWQRYQAWFTKLQ